MNWRSIALAMILPGALIAQSSPSRISLRVVDTKGAVAVISNVSIDYGGMLTKDVRTDGIWLRQGDADVSVLWSSVDSIRVTSVDESTKPHTVHLDVALRGGKHVSATLAEKGRMALLGQTDLGEYSLDLHKARLLVPIR